MSHKKPKIGFIGSGNVGASAAMICAEKELGDCVLFDVAGDVAAGKALDMYQTGPVLSYDTRVTGSKDPAILADCDVVIITAGLARKPGMTREDLQKVNAGILKSCGENLVRFAPDCVAIVVTNPLDIMTYHLLKVTGFPKERVVGQAGILDTARFRTFLAAELGVSVKDVQAMVLGGHGDTMVPVLDYTTVSGIPIREFIRLGITTEEKLKAIVQRTADGGAEIVKLLGTGSAYYAPGAAAALMAESILRDQKRVVPCSCYLEGEYGINGIYSGVPAILGRKGVEKVIEVKLSPSDLASLQKSANFYKEQAALL